MIVRVGVVVIAVGIVGFSVAVVVFAVRLIAWPGFAFVFAGHRAGRVSSCRFVGPIAGSGRRRHRIGHV